MSSAAIFQQLHRSWPGMTRYLGLAGIISLNTPAVALAETYAVDSPAPYDQCGFCHEYDGNPPAGNYPILAGQKPAYIIKQLKDYKHGLRSGSDKMKTAASQLSAHDMQVVADFYAAQKLRNNTDDAQGQDFTQARALATKGDITRGLVACDLCHLSNDTEIPRIKGQHAEYLENQLLAFKTGKRTNDEVTIMQYLSQRLSRGEIHQISAYLAAGEPTQ